MHDDVGLTGAGGADGHNFSYVAPDRERIHLTQAFDDGSKTYLQFDDTPAAGIEIRDPKSDQAVTYTVDQRYVIVPASTVP